jgi:hypothetical protein
MSNETETTGASSKELDILQLAVLTEKLRTAMQGIAPKDALIILGSNISYVVRNNRELFGLATEAFARAFQISLAIFGPDKTETEKTADRNFEMKFNDETDEDMA